MFSFARTSLYTLAGLTVIGLSGCSSASTTATAPATAATATAPASASMSPSTSPSAAETPSTGVSSPAAGTFTMAQIREHNTPDSCYVAIDKNVYDLTAWISNHPGGRGPIQGLCGTDGTSAFSAKHGEDGPQGEPQQRLATFKIGTLTP